MVREGLADPIRVLEKLHSFRVEKIVPPPQPPSLDVLSGVKALKNEGAGERGVVEEALGEGIRGKTTLETSEEDVKIHSKRVEKT